MASFSKSVACKPGQVKSRAAASYFGATISTLLSERRGWNHGDLVAMQPSAASEEANAAEAAISELNVTTSESTASSPYPGRSRISFFPASQ